jgi:hypothetical protein
MLKLEMPVQYGERIFMRQKIYYERKLEMSISKLLVLDQQEKTE